MKKILAFALVLGVVIAGLAIVVKGANTRQSISAPKAASNSTPAAALSPSTASARTPETVSAQNEVAKLSPKVRQVLTAAVLENASLNFAQLQSPAKLRQTLASTVVPEKRSEFQKVYSVIGKWMATSQKQWGYPSVREAQIRSGYYILTKEYKVDHLAGNHAVISLYWKSHYRTKADWENNQEHNVYGLSIMKMRLVNGAWLFEGTKDPRPDQVPPAQIGLSSEEMNQQFQPYLEGFHVYSATG